MVAETTLVQIPSYSDGICTKNGNDGMEDAR